MEEENKKNGLIVPFITIIILLVGLAGYVCYDKFLKKDVQDSANPKGKNISEELVGITGDELEKIEPEDGYVVFYENGKKISAFKCDGVCEVETFGDNYLEDGQTAYQVKIKNPYSEEIDTTNLDLSYSNNVLIYYCQKEKCSYIYENYFNSKDGSNDNVGTIVYYDINKGTALSYDKISYVNNIGGFLLSDKTYGVVLNGEKNKILFSDGTYREITKEYAGGWCWEGDCPSVQIGDTVVTIDSNNKYGLEDIKTGKTVIENKYGKISDLDTDYFFTAPLQNSDKDYLKVTENGKTNLYELDNDLKQITKEGYDAIYIINPTTLFVYRGNNFYFMDMQENILTEKLNIKVSSFERLPHEASVMFKKIDNYSMYIRIAPSMGIDEQEDDKENYYYKYNLTTNQLQKVSRLDMCGENAIDTCIN